MGNVQLPTKRELGFDLGVPRQTGDRTLGVSILAGGLSSRMGRHKAGLRLGRRTLMGHVRSIGSQLGVPVRVIRRDLVGRCGPLGGVYTALATSRATGELFLACDMPFVSVELLRRLQKQFLNGRPAVFVRAEGRLGFPFVLSCELLPQVREQIDRAGFSLWALAKRLGAAAVPVRDTSQLENINNPKELARARARVGTAVARSKMNL